MGSLNEEFQVPSLLLLENAVSMWLVLVGLVIYMGYIYMVVPLYRLGYV